MTEINYHKGMTMQDAPLLRKTGVVSAAGETTPFVWHGRLYRSEITTEREPVAGKQFHYRMKRIWTRIVDAETFAVCAELAEGKEYSETFVENDRLYVFCTEKSPSGTANRIWVYISDDMKTWEEHALFMRPDFRLFNTSVCRGGDGLYYMAVEAAMIDTASGGIVWDNTDTPVGHPFTEFFLKSADLLHWEWLPDECAYTKDRYCACPALRYADGYFYMICLEALPCVRYAPYIYRTRDFYTWEIGFHNPIMMMSNEDRQIQPGVVLDDETRWRVEHCFNINNSDVDLCEFNGKTYVYYSIGDQLGPGHVGEAIYDGPMTEYLKRLFL